MSMRIETAVRLETELKAELKRHVDRMAQAQAHSRAMHEGRNSILAQFYARTEQKAPNWVSHNAAQWYEGYLEAVLETNTNFLYLYEGKFYSTQASLHTGFPRWDTISQGLWSEVGDFGGSFWTTKPRNLYTHEKAEILTPRPYHTTDFTAL